MITSRVAMLILVQGALALSSSVWAGTFNVSPVRILLSAEAPSTTLRLQNQGDEPVLIQAELMAWSQETGQDVLVPTEDFVVSPPIFRVAPQGAQSIRVRLMRPADPTGELAYRLFLQEVSATPAGMQSIGVALRLGLPLFVSPRTAGTPALNWKGSLTEDGKLKLTLANQGNAHLQLTQLRVIGEDGKPLVEENLNTYILRHSTRTLVFPGRKDLPGRRLRLEGRSDAGEIRTELTVE